MVINVFQELACQFIVVAQVGVEGHSQELGAVKKSDCHNLLSKRSGPKRCCRTVSTLQGVPAQITRMQMQRPFVVLPFHECLRYAVEC